MADSPNWVFARIAERLREHLGNRYEVVIIFTGELPRREELVPLLFDQDREFDMIHFFWRNSLSDLFHPKTWARLMVTRDGDALARLAPRIASTRKTTWICDHLFLDDTLPSLWNRQCLLYAVSYGVSSRILKRIYESVTPDKTIHELQDGVDIAAFGGGAVGHRPADDNGVVIGWAGNSEWGARDEDHKGLNTIVKPAIARLQAANLPVRYRFCDRAQGWTPFSQMPRYYQSIDIFTCASNSEGTPNTVLEAMASGLPIVTTRVGVVEEVFGPLQRRLIVDSRSVASFERRLRMLVEDEALRASVRAENLDQIRSWDWKERVSAWGRFIETSLNRPLDPSSEKEQLSILERTMKVARRSLAHV